MFRFGSLTTACAALALAANLALTTPAAAHDSGNDAARAIAGLLALGLVAKSLDHRKDRHRGYSHDYYPRTYSKPYGGHHHVKRYRHHYRGIHRHRTRHGGYYRHSH
ncbi:MAG: hypothetical protein HWE35_17190 [Rhodobacteraceae bacterium]|nr:hypothetical protein [Paracoccaceae bacterium]